MMSRDASVIQSGIREKELQTAKNKLPRGTRVRIRTSELDDDNTDYGTVHSYDYDNKQGVLIDVLVEEYDALGQPYSIAVPMDSIEVHLTERPGESFGVPYIGDGGIIFRDGYRKKIRIALPDKCKRYVKTCDMQFVVLEEARMKKSETNFQGTEAVGTYSSEKEYTMRLDVSEKTQTCEKALEMSVADFTSRESLVKFTSTSINAVVCLTMRMRFVYLMWRKVPEATRLEFGKDWKSQMEAIRKVLVAREPRKKNDPLSGTFTAVLRKYLDETTFKGIKVRLRNQGGRVFFDFKSCPNTALNTHRGVRNLRSGSSTSFPRIRKKKDFTISNATLKDFCGDEYIEERNATIEKHAHITVALDIRRQVQETMHSKHFQEISRLAQIEESDLSVSVILFIAATLLAEQVSSFSTRLRQEQSSASPSFRTYHLNKRSSLTYFI